MTSVIDSIEARMEEKEDREDKRVHNSVRFGAALLIGMIVFLLTLTGILTHNSHMEKTHREERLMNACISQGWNPITCRKAVHWDWWHMKPVTKQHKK